MSPYPNPLFSDSQAVSFMRETGRHTSGHENTHRVEVNVASVQPGHHYCFMYVVCNVKGVPHAFSQSTSFFIPLPHFKKIFHVQSELDADSGHAHNHNTTQTDRGTPPGGVKTTGSAPSLPSYCGASVGATVEMSRFNHPQTTAVIRQVTDDRPANTSSCG